jgi:hypothetical protein
LVGGAFFDKLPSVIYQKTIVHMRALLFFSCCTLIFSLLACDKNSIPDPDQTGNAVLLLLDEDAIDNGNPPNNFSETDVNDQLAGVGQRQPLKFFEQRIGEIIDLYSGEVGDEGFFAPTNIPDAWKNAGPGTRGFANYLAAGPGLGSGDNPEILLDEIPGVMPMRARGLKMLIGTTILAVVYDGDININYSPITGNLQGANLGLVAFDVVDVIQRTDGSTGALPKVKVRIQSVTEVKSRQIYVFKNAPEPKSSSEPFDVSPLGIVPAPEFVLAN